MIPAVEKLSDDVKSLSPSQFDEFLAWLADYELQQSDAWDAEIERDSQPGGRL